MAASIISLLPLVSVPVVKLNALRATACCAFCGCLNWCLRRLACVVLPRKRGKALHAHRPKRRRKRKRKGREGPGCVRTCDVPVGCTCMCREGRRGHLVSLLSVCGGGERVGGGWGVCMRHNAYTLSGPCLLVSARVEIVWFSRPCKSKEASRNYTARRGGCSVLYQSPTSSY
jgi:hypothetical protein